jgi:hypothetical protein
MNYINAPKRINFSDLKEKSFSFSPWLYSNIKTPVKSCLLNDFLVTKLTSNFLGKEISRKSYIDKSTHFYLVSRAMNEESYTLVKYSQSEIPMIPTKFKDLKLKKFDILIAKDGKPGEVVILDQDYPNHMVSGGIYKLPLKDEDKLFLFFILKSDYFKQQLSIKVPRGATLKHAGKLFLDCLIPKLDTNQKSDFKKITISILNNEIKIKENFKKINSLIKEELRNQKSFNYKYPTYKEIKEENRFDTGIYTKEFKLIDNLIKEYSKGYVNFKISDFKIGSTPKKRIISENIPLKYKWITPDHVDDLGYLNKFYNIQCEKPNITKNSLLIINRTSKGGLGEFVGISFFYDVSKLGNGRCNQGFYYINNYSDTELKFFAAFLNSDLMRIYCGRLSMGSKMKELKSFHLSKIPIPNFNKNLKEKISDLYSEIMNLSSLNRKIKKDTENKISNLLN